MSFWNEIKNPVSILAPMYDVTDVVFRELISEIGKPDVLFTEFVNCDAICAKLEKIGIFEESPENLLSRMPEFASDPILRKLMITPNQKPVVAQIWGLNPETHFKTAKFIQKLGFSGIDMNMGCPQRSEMKIGACAALIDNQKLARDLISATKEGAGDVPVSVKTRIGTKEVVTDAWAGFLLAQDIAALTIHGRTAAQMSDVPADWAEIAKVVKLRDKISPKTVVIGNGDVTDFADGEKKCEVYECDGYMIGRGIFSNPEAFMKVIGPEDKENYKDSLLKIALRHLDIWEKTYGEENNFNILKKFFKIYANGYEGAAALRGQLMQTSNLAEARTLLNSEIFSN